MDCEGSQFSMPNSSSFSNDTMFEDLRRLIGLWDGGDLIEDGSTGIPSSEHAIESPPVIAGDAQDHNDQGLEVISPFESDGSRQELNHLHDLLFSDNTISDLGFSRRDGDQNAQDSYDHGNQRPQGPAEGNAFQNSEVQHVGDPAPSVNSHESVTPSAHGTAQDAGDVLLQSCFDLYHSEDPLEPFQSQGCPDAANDHSSYSAPSLSIDCAYESRPSEVWSDGGHLQVRNFRYPVETHLNSAPDEAKGIHTGDQQAQEHSESFRTCNICQTYIMIDRFFTDCGHVLCQSCHSGWVQDKTKTCPVSSTLLCVDANVMPYANSDMITESNVESGIHHEFDYAPESMLYQQQGYQPPQNWDSTNNVHRGTQGLYQVVQDRTLEYQPVRLEKWQPECKYCSQTEHFHGSLPTEGFEEPRPSVSLIDASVPIASTSKEPQQQSRQKRAREKTMVVDHNGVAMRFDGVEERFTAYYRPSYWTEDDSAVFLGEYPTFEEAKDAHNLVALVHEGPHAQIDLTPFSADRYAEELKRWEGKHHVDLICELRLRGRGFLKDGSVNFKNVSRRQTTKKTGMPRTRYYSTVLNAPGQSSNAKSANTKRGFLQTFDTPEEAARYADEILVTQKGVRAWTNFPLSSYITSTDELPLTFLPLSNNFRENLVYKRARDF